MTDLEGFWDGDFTLAGQDAAPAGRPAAPTAGRDAPTLLLDELGPSGIRIGGRDLAALLAPAYAKLTDSEG